MCNKFNVERIVKFCVKLIIKGGLMNMVKVFMNLDNIYCLKFISLRII